MPSTEHLVFAACLIALCIGVLRSPPKWADIASLSLMTCVLVGFGILVSAVWGSTGVRPERTVEQVLRFKDAGSTGIALVMGYICGSLALGSALRKLAGLVSGR